MSCNIRIPLQQIIDDVAAALSDGFIKTDNAVLNEAVLNEVTIRGDISVDTAARNALCAILQTCGITAVELEWLDRPTVADMVAVSEVVAGEVVVSWKDLDTLITEGIVGKVQTTDVLDSLGVSQEEINTDIRNELDALPFEDGVLADTFVTVEEQITGEGALSLKDFNSRSVFTVSDITELLKVKAADGRSVLVKGLQGGTFVYDSTKSTINDGGYIINGWVRQVYNSSLSPEMFGALGDGVHDDRLAISKAIDAAAGQKLTIVCTRNKEYLISSFTYSVGGVNIIFNCLNNYLDLNLNGATLKVSDNIGEWYYMFNLTSSHEYAKFYNGTIDSNTRNNPAALGTKDLNTRIIVGNYSGIGGRFIVDHINFKDFLGQWAVVCPRYDEFVYTNNKLSVSNTSFVYTDRTMVYTFARKTEVLDNEFIGDSNGNAVTAVEFHAANSNLRRNKIIGFRSALFIVGDNVVTDYPIMDNINVEDNELLQCSSPIIIWTESGVADKHYKDIKISRNTINVDTRLTTNNPITDEGVGISTIEYGWDAQNISNLTINDNVISHTVHDENLAAGSMHDSIRIYTSIESASFILNNVNIYNNTLGGSIVIGNSGSGLQFNQHKNINVHNNNFLDVYKGSKDACINFTAMNQIDNSSIHSNNYFRDVSSKGASKAILIDTKVGFPNGNVPNGLQVQENLTKSGYTFADCEFMGAYIDIVSDEVADTPVSKEANIGSTIKTGKFCFKQVKELPVAYWVVSYFGSTPNTKMILNKGGVQYNYIDNTTLRIGKSGFGWAMEWTAQTPVQDYIYVSSDGFVYKCMGAGTTGSAGIVKPNATGDTVFDGGVWWKLLGEAATLV